MTALSAGLLSAVGQTHAAVLVRAWRSGERQRSLDGRIPLQSERRWVIEGPRRKLADIEAVLPVSAWRRAGNNALVLNVVNSVGILELPHVGRVELFTAKLGDSDFEALLADLTELATSLPFSAGDPGSRSWDSGVARREEVLYHVFVYLRYILSELAPTESRLIPALELIQRTPHRRWQTERRDVPIEALTRVDSRTLLDLVTATSTSVPSSSLSSSGAVLASRLGGQLPEAVSERRIRATIDTPENRFVKVFIGQLSGIIGRTRMAVDGRGNAFEKNLLDDCERMEAALMPIVRHAMWDEVGTMGRIPLASTVLQRRRGYRHVLRHFARIRLAPRIPLDRREMRDLLELKDIATLYEIWTFFRLADLLRALIGPPIRGARPTRNDQFQVSLGRNRTFEWTCGIRLAYNQTFAPPEASYSVGLRPDIALHLPEGPNKGLHLMDAKFSLTALSDAGVGSKRGQGSRAEAAERKGTFTHGDLYKMHTYRDAIPSARSVWILYPGTEFRFFDASGGRSVGRSPEDLPNSIRGVGALPFTPKLAVGSTMVLHGMAEATLRRLRGG